MAVTIIYETHSITTDNEAGIATGWLPGRLSAEGRRLARELGRRRRDDNLAVVFTSDLARAVETADLAFGDRGIPIVQDARLRECDYGALNGMPMARLAVERCRRIDTPFPGGQSYRQVVTAMDDFLRDLARDWDGREVLIVAHSANRWALEVLLGGAALEALVDAPFVWQEGWRFTLPADWGKSGGSGAAEPGRPRQAGGAPPTPAQ
jgi:broad specificity phosphatase PhoE